MTDGLSSTRMDKGLSLKELAGWVEISPVHLSRVERGIKQPSAELLVKLALVLDVPLDAISTREPREVAA